MTGLVLFVESICCWYRLPSANEFLRVILWQFSVECHNGIEHIKNLGGNVCMYIYGLDLHHLGTARTVLNYG
jgi:hypothetical protein